MVRYWPSNFRKYADERVLSLLLSNCLMSGYEYTAKYNLITKAITCRMRSVLPVVFAQSLACCNTLKTWCSGPTNPADLVQRGLSNIEAAPRSDITIIPYPYPKIELKMVVQETGETVP